MNLLLYELLNPLLLLLFVIACLLVSLWWRRGAARKRFWLLTIAFCLLWFACTPLAAHLSLRTLERGYGPLQNRPQDVQAIVVLSGSIRPPNPSRGWTELEHDSLRRCLEAVRLYRQGDPVQVIVSGGKVDSSQPGPTFAEAMAEFLAESGIDEIVEERRSRNTYENAVETAAILRELDVDRCILVTDSTHQMRATACFRAQGIRCIPAGAYCRSEELKWGVSTFLPIPWAAEAQQVVLHEWIGLAWYRLRGRI